MSVGAQLGSEPALTRRQRDVLLLIQDAIAKTGLAPSYDEIAAGLGNKSKSYVQRAVIGLEERGAIRRVPYRARAIELLRPIAKSPSESKSSPAPDVIALLEKIVALDSCEALIEDAFERLLPEVRATLTALKARTSAL